MSGAIAFGVALLSGGLLAGYGMALWKAIPCAILLGFSSGLVVRALS